MSVETGNAGVRVTRFAIVGCGSIGRWHGKILRWLPDAALAAVTDADAVARREAGRAFAVAAPDSLEEVLADPAIDVVSICTPPDTHVALVERVAAAGKHALVEKPLALNPAEADRAIEACRRHGVHLGVVHQQRASSSTLALRALLADGAFGVPRIAAAVHTWYRAPEELAGHAWRGRTSSGGGVLLDQAVHAIDLLVCFLGAPRWTSGAIVFANHGASGEDTAVATLGFDSGAVATLAASTTSNRMRDDISIDLGGTRGGFRLEIRDYDHAEITSLDLAEDDGVRAQGLSSTEIERHIRRHGGAWREGPRAWPWRGITALLTKERGADPFRSPRAFLRRQADRVAQRERGELQGHAAVIAAMAAAARGEGEPLVTGREARAAIAVIDAIQRSQREGGRRIELREPEQS